MNQLEDILVLPTALLALGLFIVSFTIRKYCEALWPGLSSKTPTTRVQRIWEGVVLPTLPAFLGLLFCGCVSPAFFPYPAVVAQTVSRLLYGLGTGWFSGWGYRVLSFAVLQKWNIALPGDSTPPPPEEP